MSDVGREAEDLLQRVLGAGYGRVMLLGTREHMTEPTFRRPLAASGVLVLVPGEADRALVDEVARGSERGLGDFRALVEHGLEHGAQAVVVTHAGLLPALQAMDLQVPLVCL